MTTHIAHHLLSQAHPPPIAESLFTDRIKQKPLFLSPTTPDAADARTRRRNHRLQRKSYFLRKQKPRPLSAKEKRVSGVYDIPRDECRFEVFKGLNKLWVGYMWDVLELGRRGGGGAGGAGTGIKITPHSHGSRLVSADFHGAWVEVARSGCYGRVGVRGIVVRDTKFTFVLVTERDEVKTIPKEQTIFRFTVPLPTGDEVDKTGDTNNDGNETAIAQSANANDREAGRREKKKELVFELHGNQFKNRPVDRANKKFKWRNVEYL